jgi:hypothetical protein
LPIYPEMPAEHVDRVAAELRAAVPTPDGDVKAT